MAACAQCGETLPRGASACPTCGTAAPRPATRASAAKPAKASPAKAASVKPAGTPVPGTQPVAKPAKPTVAPVVKSAALPVTPAVKSGAPAAARKAAAKPAAKAAPSAARKPAARKSAATSSAADAEWGSVTAPTPGSPAAQRAARKSTPPPVAPEPVIAEEAAAPAVAEAAPTAPPVTRTAPLVARQPWPAADVVGEAEERDPADPVVPLPPPPPGMLAELFEPAAEDGRPPLPLRIVRGNWAPALLTALPALAATLVVAMLATAGILTGNQPGGDEPLFGETTAGRWFQYVFAAVGLAFGAPVRARTEIDRGEQFGEFEDFAEYQREFSYTFLIRFAPLTITLAALVALWLLARRFHGRNLTADRVPDAVRTALVFAAGVAGIAALGRWTVKAGRGGGFEGAGFETTTTFAAVSWKAFFWASLAAFAVVWLATGRDVAPPRLARWLLAVRGALVGLGSGIAASFLLLVALGYTYADKVDADSNDVTSVLPVAGGYAVNLGTHAFGVLSGGTFSLPFGATRFALWTEPVPKPFLLMLVVPALAVLVGALFITRRGGVPAKDAARTCALMGLPAALAWLLLAIAATARAEGQGSQFGGISDFGLIGATVVGAVLWDAVLVGLWFGAGGWLAGRLLARRSAPVDQPEHAPVP